MAATLTTIWALRHSEIPVINSAPPPVSLPGGTSAALGQKASCGKKFTDFGNVAYVKRPQQSKVGFQNRKMSVPISAGAREGLQHYPEKLPPTPFLDKINNPIHIKSLSMEELRQLANELRSETIFMASKTKDHLGSSLGAVELTVAMHHVFNAPEDKCLWDSGNQIYPHKILTERRKMFTLQQTDRLWGHDKLSESEHDTLGAGQSASSMSAGLGMAVGRDLKGRKNNVVSVIEDESMAAGQAFEAMNHTGFLGSRVIMVLNDNRQVPFPTATLDGTLPPVGALRTTLRQLQSSRPLLEFEEVAKGVTKQSGGPVHGQAFKVDKDAQDVISGSGSTLFEELGLHYIGPVDGHNIDDLVTILNKVKGSNTNGPVLIHVVTEKGRGYPYPEQVADIIEKKRGLVKFDSETGKQLNGQKAHTQAYTSYYAEALIAEAEQDQSIVSIHGAVRDRTGLDMFLKRFPKRSFDVGIAKQHAVTFAAGLACEGFKPFCTIDSSFLQRAYDQVVHDVDLQKLPVRFAMDCAGLVGADGSTHFGAFDVAYMACLPNMVVMAPSDEAELFHMVATAAAIDDRPSFFRYPRGRGIGAAPLPPGNKGRPIELGNGRILVEGTQVALLGYGSMVQNCLGAQGLLAECGVSATVADARFCKPLDKDLIRRLAKDHAVLVAVEEGSVGGFGSHVAQFMAFDGLLDGKLKWRPLVLPDRYVDRRAPTEQIAEAGLTAFHIAATALNALAKNKEALEIMSSFNI